MAQEKIEKQLLEVIKSGNLQKFKAIIRSNKFKYPQGLLNLEDGGSALFSRAAQIYLDDGEEEAIKFVHKIFTSNDADKKTSEYKKFKIPRSIGGATLGYIGEKENLDYEVALKFMEDFFSQIQEKFAEFAQARQEKDDFVLLAKENKLTKNQIVALAQKGLNIDCNADRKKTENSKDDGKNALHYAIENCNLDLVKMLYEGVEFNDARGKNKIARIDFDKRASQILDDMVRADPDNTKILEMKQYFNLPLKTKSLNNEKPSTSPNLASKANCAASLKAAGQQIAL